VSGPVRVAVAWAGEAPEVRLLDARSTSLDEAGLRAWARRVTDAAGAAHQSRSYRHPYCVIAWYAEPVGIDIERIEALDNDFLRSISTPSELTEAAGHGSGNDRDASSRWCAKEALAKALGDAIAYDPRRLDSPARWPDGRSGPWCATDLVVEPQHVVWLCWRDTGSEQHRRQRDPAGHNR